MAAEESPLEESPLENVPVIEPAAVASDAESEMAQEQAAEGDNEPLVEPAVGIQDPAVEAEMPALEEEEMMQSEVCIREVHAIGGCTYNDGAIPLPGHTNHKRSQTSPAERRC